MKTTIKCFLPVLLIISSAFHSRNTNNTHELIFVDHLKAGLIEQDVFIEKVPGSGLVYRVLPQERQQYLDAPLYTIETPQPHDPFDVNKSGPFKKGQSLGISLRDWLGATGQATCHCEGGWGTFNATFENLIPEAVYTLWHIFVPAPPTEPFTGALELPMGDRDGTQSIFTTDCEGNAEVNLRFERCLELGNHQLKTGVAIAYHSDRKTYASSPGPFGKVTHVQLFAMLPSIKDLPVE